MPAVFHQDPYGKEVRFIAIYHLSIKIISRGKGKSAVAAAAYRAGQTITNEYDGITHDYTRKGGIVHTEILLPDNAPAEFADRAVLWNAVEKIEKAKNAQLAREIELALPGELSREENIALARAYAKAHFVSAGMCADVCIHDKEDGNPHAHILLTMRPFSEDGSWGTKQKKEYILDERGEKIYDKKKRAYKCKSIPSTDWNDQTKAEEWRHGWADAVNASLREKEVAQRVDHRSYERQGIEQIPTVHVGAAAMQMEKRGIPTERGSRNREIGRLNQLLRRLQARIIKLKHWVEEELKNAVPAFAALFAQGVEKVKAGTRYFTERDQKISDEAYRYLTENGISNMAELDNRVNGLRERLYTARGELKDTEWRMDELEKRIGQAETYQRHKAAGMEYRQLKPRKQEKYRRDHETELLLFESAERYLKRYASGAAMPLAEWKAEREKLAGRKGGLYQRYHALREETERMETVQRAVKKVMHQPKKEQVMARKKDKGKER